MALHHKKHVSDHRLAEDGDFTSSTATACLPRYRMPAQEQDPRIIYQLIHDELMLDGNSRQNLATFCQTWLEPEVRKLMDDCIDKNMIDKDEYPQTAEIESRCIHMLADLWNSPVAATTVGCSTTGSSEAAMLGGLAMKWRWREKMRAAGKPADRPNLVTGPVQICWHKFCRYFDVEIREVPMEPGRYCMGTGEVLAAVDENTIGVVPTLGQTFTMQYEPVAEIAAALDALQTRTGLDIPIHVDGASGAFLAPFLTPDLVWDFRISRVKSINASGHKFGLSPLGVGWVIWREAADLPKDLIFDVNYLGGDMPTFALNFSRPGGQVVCQYFTMLRLGRDGFRKVQEASADIGQYLADEIAKYEMFDVIYDGRGGIPGCTWTFASGIEPAFTLYDLADRLRTRGWLVPAYALPANCEDVVVQRILCRNGFTYDLATLFLSDLQRAIEHFEGHPVSTPLTQREAGSFNHTR
ncbi:MAG: glutamate decarboxylase [Capsulimonadaceae bacterium]